MRMVGLSISFLQGENKLFKWSKVYFLNMWLVKEEEIKSPSIKHKIKYSFPLKNRVAFHQCDIAVEGDSEHRSALSHTLTTSHLLVVRSTKQ